MISAKEEAVNIQSLKTQTKFCQHCDMVVLNSGVRKRKAEIPFLCKDDMVGCKQVLVDFTLLLAWLPGYLRSPAARVRYNTGVTSK